MLKIRRALITVSDKSGVVELAQTLEGLGAEIIATGRTAQVLTDAGVRVIPIEKISGSPEAFQGRMKTLSFSVCGGILARRNDPEDEADLQRLGILPIDCVVVNFYPFEAAVAEKKVRQALIEEIDIGGPTLVRAAAKNAPDVLVLTEPDQYAQVIQELKAHGQVHRETVLGCARLAWDRVARYDDAIQREVGGGRRLRLRYGENPHQSGYLDYEPSSPLAWDEKLSPTELSYNNILDLSSAYGLACDLRAIDPEASGAVVVKHNNPCGVALIPKRTPLAHSAQKEALLRAWEGDPVSAFGGVLIFTDPLEADTAQWLSERFVELIAAPGLRAGGAALDLMLGKRKNLKAVSVRHWYGQPSQVAIPVPGGVLHQSADLGLEAELKCVTEKSWPDSKKLLARFGIAITRSLKSNALSIVREIAEVKGSLQLVGAGQGQPNRVEALKKLAIPRAQAVMGGQSLRDCVLVSDAFFPFRDTVDSAAASGLQWIVQPGGSVKDSESIKACNEHGVSMVFTGVRHFRH